MQINMKPIILFPIRKRVLKHCGLLLSDQQRDTWMKGTFFPTVASLHSDGDGPRCGRLLPILWYLKEETCSQGSDLFGRG